MYLRKFIRQIPGQVSLSPYQAPALAQRWGSGTVFGVMLISAIFVIIVRLLGPLVISWDLGIQLEAAYRLAGGLGLTNAFSSQLDLNQPPISENLTHFPPGLSLLIAAFLFCKIPLAIALKIIYGCTTLIGWLGWSTVASRCLSQSSLVRGTGVIPFHLLIAAILPIFYTPSWTHQGTDIFLWAGVPFFTLLLLRSQRHRFWLASTLLASLIVGALLAFRYASGFLIIAAALIIIYTEFPKLKPAFVRLSIFALPFILVTLPVGLYIQSVSDAEFSAVSSNNFLQTHGARYLNQNLLAVTAEAVNKFIDSLSKLYLFTGVAPEQLLDQLTSTYPGVNKGLGLIALIAIFLLPLILVAHRKRANSSQKRDLLVSLSLLLVSLILFSAPLTVVISYSPLIVGRYYLPVEICLILIACSAVGLSQKKLIQRTLSLFLVTFIVFNLIGVPIHHFLVKQNGSIHSFFISLGRWQTADISYPSNEVLTIDQDTLDILTSLEIGETNPLFFTQDYPYYISYFNFQNPSRFRRISDKSFWESAYLSEKTQIFWVINSKKCASICASGGNFNSDNQSTPIEMLVSLPNLKTIFTNDRGDVAIMTAELPANYHFSNSSSHQHEDRQTL